VQARHLRIRSGIASRFTQFEVWLGSSTSAGDVEDDFHFLVESLGVFAACCTDLVQEADGHTQPGAGFRSCKELLGNVYGVEDQTATGTREVRMVVRQVVDAVGDELSLASPAEVVVVRLHRLLREGLAGTVEIPQQFLLLRVDAEDRIANRGGFQALMCAGPHAGIRRGFGLVGHKQGQGGEDVVSRRLVAQVVLVVTDCVVELSVRLGLLGPVEIFRAVRPTWS
jgi:hypothetical protein